MSKQSVYIKLIIAIIMAFISIYFAKLMFSLNVLPTNFSIILIGALISMNMIGDLCLFLKGKWIKIVTGVLYSLLLFISCVGIKYGSETLNFLSKGFSNNTYEITTYNVLVRTDTYNNINELSGKDVGYFNSDANKNEMLSELKKEISYNEVGYEDIFELYSGLINFETEAIIIDENLQEELVEDSTYDKTSTKVIYSFDIKSKNKNAELTDEQKNAIKDLKSFSIFLSGSDTESTKVHGKSRSDVNMIISVNPKKKKILLTSIPRDYYVSIADKEGLKDKLTHAGIYGLDSSVKTVENFFDIDINYSIKVGFQSLIKIVDIVGSIEVESDTDFMSSHINNWKVVKGKNTLDGKKALAYSRERYAYKDGDNHRIKNQQQVLTALIKKITESKTLLANYSDILESLTDLYTTDIPSELITTLIKETLKGGKWDVESISVSGTSSYELTYTSPNSKRSVEIPNMDTVNSAKEKIKEIIEG